MPSVARNMITMHCAIPLALSLCYWRDVRLMPWVHKRGWLQMSAQDSTMLHLLTQLLDNNCCSYLIHLHVVTFNNFISNLVLALTLWQVNIGNLCFSVNAFPTILICLTMGLKLDKELKTHYAYWKLNFLMLVICIYAM